MSPILRPGCFVLLGIIGSVAANAAPANQTTLSLAKFAITTVASTLGGCVPDGSPTNPCPNPNDDWQDLQGNDCPMPNGSKGPGLHVTLANGNVWTRVPIFVRYGNGEESLSLTLTYNSLLAGASNSRGLGYGWTHDYDIRTEYVPEQRAYSPPVSCCCSCGGCGTGSECTDGYGNPGCWGTCGGGEIRISPPQLVVIDGDGRRNAYSLDSPEGSGQIITPPGRNAKLASCSGGGCSAGEAYVLSYPDGSKTYFAVDGKVTRMVSACLRTLTFAHNGPSNRLSQVTDGFGKSVGFNYDANGMLIEIVHPDSGTLVVKTTLSYVSGELRSITDPLGHITSFEYDSAQNHRITSETLKNGCVFRCDYSNTSGLTGILDGLQARTITADRPSPQSPERVLVVARQIFPTQRGTLATGGSQVYSQDGNGFTWIYSSHADWGTLDSKTPQGFDALGYFMGVELGGNAATNPSFRRVNYIEEAGKLRKEFTWGAQGTLLQLTVKPVGSNDFPDYVTMYSYSDSRFPGLVTRKQLPNGGAWEYTYTDKGDLAQARDPLGQSESTTFTYYGGSNPPGRLFSVDRVDRNGWHKLTRYYASGDLFFEQEYTSQSAYIRTEYTSDAMGRVTQKKAYRSYPGGSTAITKYEYDLMGRMTKMIENYVGQTTSDPKTENLTTEYTYDDYGLLLSVKNPRGYVTSYEYDHRNHLNKKTEDAGTGGLNLVTIYENDGNGNVKKITDPRNNITTITNGPTGDPKFITDAEGYKTRIERDSMGHVAQIFREKAPGSMEELVLTSQYDGLGRPKSITRFAQASLPGVLYDYSFNVGAGGCGCNGLGTDLPFKTTRTISGTPVAATYNQLDANGRLIKVIGKAANFNTPSQEIGDFIVEYAYDAEGNETLKSVAQATGPIAANELSRTSQTYDGADRVLTRTIKATPSADMVTTYGWNGVGNITHADLPNGSQLTYVYDAADRLTSINDAEGEQFIHAFDANGNLISEWDGATTRTYEYDRLDRLTITHDARIETPTDLVTSFEYDGNGNRTGIVDNNNMRTCMVYDKINRLRKTVEAATNQDCSAPTGGATIEYGYDGRFMTSLKDNEGNETTYDYDGAGRITEAVYPVGMAGSTEGERDVQFRYGQGTNLRGIKRTDQRDVDTLYDFDAFGHLVSRSYSGVGISPRTEYFTFDRAGRLLSADNGVSRFERTYDLAGRVLTETQCYPTCSSGAAYATTFTYAFDTSAQTLTRTTQYPDPAGLSPVHVQDFRGRMVLAQGASNLGESRQYYGDQLVAVSRYNGIEDELGYDDGDRLNLIRRYAYPAGGTTTVSIPGRTYAYDAVGNRLHAKRIDDGQLLARSEFYEYDARHRLKTMRRGTPDASGTGVGSYGYSAVLAHFQEWPDLDSRGNWLSFDETIGMQSGTVENPIEPPTRVHTRSANAVNEYTSLSIDADGPGGPASPWTGTTSFDKAGNILFDPSALVAGNACASLPAPGCGSGQEYDYDEENRVKAIRRDTDDAANPPWSPETAIVLEFKYDALGRRVETVEHIDPATGQAFAGGAPRHTRHIYNGLETIQEYTCSAAGTGCDGASPNYTLARQFLWGDSDKFPDPVGMLDHTGAGGVLPPGPWPYHYLKDALGSVVGLARDYLPTGFARLAERYTYDPYGRPYVEKFTTTGGGGSQGYWSASNVGCGGSATCGALTYSLFGNPFLWTGQRFDAASGTYHFLFRTYLPWLGRWAQRDPAGFIDGVNLYEYVVSNPLAFIDQLGNAASANTACPGRRTSCVNNGPSPNTPKRIPGVFDPNNSCHSACKSGATSSGMCQPMRNECQQKCIEHCDKKEVEGFCSSPQHAGEFWDFDSRCGASAETRKARKDCSCQPEGPGGQGGEDKWFGLAMYLRNNAGCKCDGMCKNVLCASQEARCDHKVLPNTIKAKAQSQEDDK